jgi:CRP-like cAMP-binding protein
MSGMNVELVRETPAFAGLNATQLENFLAACVPVHFSEGERMITRGVSGEHVYFIHQGQLSVRVPTPEGVQELARLVAPAIVGEMEMLTELPRTADVYAKTTVDGIAIEIATFRERLADGDTAALKVVRNIAPVVAHRLSALVRRIVEIDVRLAPNSQLDLAQFRSKLFSDWST